MSLAQCALAGLLPAHSALLTKNSPALPAAAGSQCLVHAGQGPASLSCRAHSKPSPLSGCSKSSVAFRMCVMPM